jgi:hypothetical protein
MAGMMHNELFDRMSKPEAMSNGGRLAVKDYYEGLSQLPQGRAGDDVMKMFGDLELTDYGLSKLNLDEQKTLNKLMRQYGEGLSMDDRQSLQKALTAAISGDMNDLKTMVPYAPNMMAIDAQEPFKKAMASLGYKVDITGSADRTPFGERHGGMTITRSAGPNDTSICLSYDRNEGPLAQDRYKVEVLSKPAVFLQK